MINKTKTKINKIKYYLQRCYRLTLSYQKQEEVVWEALKELHADAGWKHGIYEKEKYVETAFEISEGKGGLFYYMIYDRCFHCRVQILEDYPVELTTDLFILASHFNNVLNSGVVIVNPNSQYVEYHQKRELVMTLLYTDQICSQMDRHFLTSKEIYLAFQRLVTEQEEPAIIIADLLKELDAKNDETK
jgi:hypothetical protein